MTGVAYTAVAAAVPIFTDPLKSYYDALNALDRESARLDVAKAPEAEWQRWERQCDTLYREIERMPPSPAAARLKARAVWSIVAGNLDDINAGESVACRLVRQIVCGLAGVN